MAKNLRSDLDNYKRRVRLHCQFRSSRQNNAASKFHVSNPQFQPKLASFEVEQYLEDVEAALKQCYSHSSPSEFRFQSNLSKEEWQALDSLRLDSEIIISPTDKNLGVAILDKDWYVNECQRHLDDTNSYEQVLVNPEHLLKNLEKQILDSISRWMVYVPFEVTKYLQYSTAEYSVPEMYVLPKIHKPPPYRGRPIVPSKSFVTSGLSVYMADLLNQTLVTDCNILKDTRQLIRELDGMMVPRDCLLCTADIESLFTNVDADEAIQVCADRVKPGTLRPVAEDFLHLIMHNNFFKCLGKFWHQKFGCAMGTSCSPPFANIYMSHLEAELRASCPDRWPKLFRRFLDDIFLVWQFSEEDLLAFLNLYNQLRPRIKLTWNISRFSVDYCDIVITKDMSYMGDMVPIVLTTHQKLNNRYLYLPFSSQHNRHVYKGLVWGELQRYVVTNSEARGFEIMKARFLERLVKRGYPKETLLRWFSSIHYDNRRYYLDKTKVRPKMSSVPVFVTSNTAFDQTVNLSNVLAGVYNAHKNALCHVFGSEPPPVAYRRCRSLQSFLVNRKLF